MVYVHHVEQHGLCTPCMATWAMYTMYGNMGYVHSVWQPGYNNTDLVIARTSLASFSNDDWIRHPSHQDRIWRRSFLCCWIARVECSSRWYKEHYWLVILQMSHQDTFLYWHIWIKQFSTLYYVRRFWTIFGGGGCKMCHINEVYLLT